MTDKMLLLILANMGQGMGSLASGLVAVFNSHTALTKFATRHLGAQEKRDFVAQIETHEEHLEAIKMAMESAFRMFEDVRKLAEELPD